MAVALDEDVFPPLKLLLKVRRLLDSTNRK